MIRRRVDMTLTFVTPLVMAGVETKDPEPRLPSLRGLLRWWYRIGSGCDRDGEARLFGAVGQDGARAGLFRLRWAGGVPGSPSPLSSYPGYLGFSLRWRKKDDRVWGFQAPHRWNVRVDFEPSARDDDVQRFLATAWLCFTLGCAGFRARRGFGAWKVDSFTIQPPSFNPMVSFKPQGVTPNHLVGFLHQNLLNIYQKLSWPLYFRVWICDLSWSHLEAQYRDYRRAIHPRDRRAVWGLPIQGVSDDRLASPVWFKPWNAEGPCLITSIRPWWDQFGWPPNSRVNPANGHLLEDFIDYLLKQRFSIHTVRK